MTASRIFRSRRDSSCEAISANLGTTSNHCQVGCEAIEPQPAERRERESITVSDRTPPSVYPRLGTNKFRTGETQPIRCAQPEVYVLRGPAVIVQQLVALYGIYGVGEPTLPFDVSVGVPTAGAPIELVRPGTEAGVRDAPPVHGIVAGTVARAAEVRDFVVFEAGGRH